MELLNFDTVTACNSSLLQGAFNRPEEIPVDLTIMCDDIITESVKTIVTTHKLLRDKQPSAAKQYYNVNLSYSNGVCKFTSTDTRLKSFDLIHVKHMNCENVFSIIKMND